MSELMNPSWITVPIRNEAEEVIGVTPVRYDQFVMRLWKQMDFDKMVGHAGRGIASEAGEINDCLKKHLDYGQELNLSNLIEELGDMKFFMQALQNLYGIPEHVILQANADKLSKRYLNLQYSDEQAKLRRDKSDGSK